MRSTLWFLPVIPLLVLIAMCALVSWIAKGGSPRAAVLQERLGLTPHGHKADEMEQQIQAHSIKIAYFVTLAMLVGGNFYQSFVRNEPLPLLNGVIIVAILTQSFAALVLRHRSVAGDDEYHPYPLWKKCAAVVGLGMAVAAIGALLCISFLAA